MISCVMLKKSRTKIRKLSVHGPFEIPHIKSKLGSSKFYVVDTERIRVFWETVVGGHENGANVGSKDGIYVFAMKAGKGHTAWYIGKATKSLEKEAFTQHKLTKYNEVISNVTGTPVMFFLTSNKPKTRNLPISLVGRIEKDLIRQGILKNPKLMNKQNAKDTTAWKAAGKGLKKFNNMMGT